MFEIATHPRSPLTHKDPVEMYHKSATEGSLIVSVAEIVLGESFVNVLLITGTVGRVVMGDTKIEPIEIKAQQILIDD